MIGSRMFGTTLFGSGGAAFALPKPCRYMVIAYEDRFFEVEIENRFFGVVYENRFSDVAIENRFGSVVRETRSSNPNCRT